MQNYPFFGASSETRVIIRKKEDNEKRNRKRLERNKAYKESKVQKKQQKDVAKKGESSTNSGYDNPIPMEVDNSKYVTPVDCQQSSITSIATKKMSPTAPATSTNHQHILP